MFKVKTTYTKENFLQFQKYHFFHESKARIIFTIFGILFIGVGTIGLIQNKFDFSLFELILGIVLLIEFNTPIIPILQTKYILKSDSMLIGLENEFTFYEDHIEVENKRSSTKIPYQELYCCRKTKEYYYIYINKASAFLVKREDEKLDHFLADKIKHGSKKM